MSLLYGTGNYVDATTLYAVTTEDPTYPMENLYNQRPSMAFRCLSPTTLNIDVDAGLGSTLQPILVAVLNHNLASVTTFRLYGSNVGFGGAGEQWDLTLCANHNNSGRKITPAVGYRYWRLAIVGTVASGNVEIGEFVLTTWSTFTNFYVVDESEGPALFSGSHKTHWGQPWDSYRSKSMVFTLQPIQRTATVGNIDEMRLFLQAIQGCAGRFVFSPDDTYISSKCQLYYVKIAGEEFLASRVKTGAADLLQWDLRLEELPKGIGLL